jgi:hypothetical protein
MLSPASTHTVAAAAENGRFDATVQKMLFGDVSPLSANSAPAGIHCTISTATAAPRSTTTPVRGSSDSDMNSTPATATVSLTPNSEGSAATVENCPVVVRLGNTATAAADVTASTAQELAACLSREKDYKAALYLLQEEVRHLRAQTAQYDAAKRAVRLHTPKGAAARKKASLAQTPAAANLSATVKPGGCVRKLLFPAHA